MMKIKSFDEQSTNVATQPVKGSNLRWLVISPMYGPKTDTNDGDKRRIALVKYSLQIRNINRKMKIKAIGRKFEFR